MKTIFSLIFFITSIFLLLVSSSTRSQDSKLNNNALYSENTTSEENLRLFFESFLNKETIDAFNRFHCLDSDKYEYSKIDIADNKMSMFTCGTSDIEYVTERLPVKIDLRKESVVKAIDEYEADFQDMKIASSYDRYFPVTLFLQGKSQYPFRRVNVDAVTWLSNNIIPAPDTPINGVSAQDIYDKNLRNFFRSMKFYYDYLHNELNLDYELMLYKEMIAEEDSSMAGSWLYFWYNRKDYGSEINMEVNPHQFMGFWLRRELDGSADALHDALLKIINLYDKESSSPSSLIDNTSSFVPAGYEISEEVAGDLNKDGRQDRVIAIKNKNDNTEPRKIIVLLQNENSTFQQDQESSSIIPSEYTTDGTQVFNTASLTIELNNLVVITWGFTSNTTSTFRYIDGQLRLIRIKEFASGAGGYSELILDLIASTIKHTETNTMDENMPSETTTKTFQFPEVTFENTNPDEIVKNTLNTPAGEIITGTLVSGGGIDNYSLLVQTIEGDKIEAYCQPDCGDWFDDVADSEGVTLKNSLKDKKVSMVYAVEANNGRLAGPSNDEKYIFLKQIEFLE